MKTKFHLDLDFIKSKLQRHEEEIMQMTAEQFPASVRVPIQNTEDPAERERLLNEARLELVSKRIHKFVDENRKTAICADCGMDFTFFRCIDVKTYSRHSQTCDLKVCLDCVESAERQELKAQFFKLHRSAAFYLRQTDAPPKPKQFEAVVNWTSWDEVTDKRIRTGILASGASGSGKTTAMYELFFRQHMEGYEVLIVDANSLASTITESARGIGQYKTVTEYFEFLATFDLLGIDDLDKARFTPRVASELFKLVELWCRELQKPLFVTTNSSSKEMVKLFPPQIGSAIVNRLAAHTRHISFSPPAKSVRFEKIVASSTSSNPEEIKDEDEDREEIEAE